MRRFLWFVLLLCISINGLLSLNFNIETVNEFAISTSYTGTNLTKQFVVEYPYLYTATEYGLEIYLIEDNGYLVLTSRLSIIGCWSIAKLNDKVYIGTEIGEYDLFYARLYEIDVNDPYNPFISNSLELIGIETVWNIFVVQDHLLLHNSSVQIENPYYLINQNLDIVESYTIDSPPLLLFGDNFILSATGGFSYVIYDFTVLNEIAVVGSGNISEAHEFSIRYQEEYQNDILIFSNQREISFWNISEPSNWQLLDSIDLFSIDPNIIMNVGGRFLTVDNYLLYLGVVNFIVLDLNEYSIIQNLELDNFYYGGGIDHCSWMNNIYISTNFNGILWFQLDGNEVEYSGRFGENNYNFDIQFSDNYCFVGSGYFNQDGIKIYSIIDPLNIEQINIFREGIYQSFKVLDHYLVVRKANMIEDDTVDIYDMSDPQNPQIRNSLCFNDWLPDYPTPFIDENDVDVIYFYLWNNKKLVKFDVGNPGEVELIFDYDLEINGIVTSVVLSEDNFYILHKRGSSNWYDLRIFSGLSQNELYIHDLSYFCYSISSPSLRVEDNFLIVFNWAAEGPGGAKFYLLDDQFNPILNFENSYSGYPHLSNEILFHTASFSLYVFDVINASGVISPMTYIPNNGWGYRMHTQEANGVKYLYCASVNSICVYEYSYDLSTYEELIDVPLSTTLSQNYPNPFNPETIIEFYLENEGRVKLEIFNIKGQRVSQLIDEVLTEGKHSIVWNPIDQSGKTLPSGVYLYHLKTGDYQHTRKMLYLK